MCLQNIISLTKFLIYKEKNLLHWLLCKCWLYLCLCHTISILYQYCVKVCVECETTTTPWVISKIKLTVDQSQILGKHWGNNRVGKLFSHYAMTRWYFSQSNLYQLLLLDSYLKWQIGCSNFNYKGMPWCLCKCCIC